MSAIFVHDHFFFRAKTGIYSRLEFTDSLWKRYRKHWGRVCVVGRDGGQVSIDEANKLIYAGGDQVEFNLLPTISGILPRISKVRKVRKELFNVLNGSAVVICRLPSELGFEALRISRKLRIPSVAEVVGCPYDALRMHQRRIGRLYAPVAKWRMRRAVKKSENVMYVTQQFLQKRYPACTENIVSASNVNISVDSETAVRSAEAKFTKRRERGTLKIGFIGSFDVKYKGLAILVKALSRIDKKMLANVQVEVAGPGNIAAWEAEVIERGFPIRFLGVLDRNMVREWMHGVDVIVHPSLTEGLPRVIIEAMACGCAVLGSTAGGIPELISEEFLHAPANSEQLSQQIIRFIHSSEDILAAAKCNAIKVKVFDKEILSARRDLFYKKVLSGHHA